MSAASHSKPLSQWRQWKRPKDAWVSQKVAKCGPTLGWTVQWRLQWWEFLLFERHRHRPGHKWHPKTLLCRYRDRLGRAYQRRCCLLSRANQRLVFKQAQKRVDFSLYGLRSDLSGALWLVHSGFSLTVSPRQVKRLVRAGRSEENLRFAANHADVLDFLKFDFPPDHKQHDDACWHSQLDPAHFCTSWSSTCILSDHQSGCGHSATRDQLVWLNRVPFLGFICPDNLQSALHDQKHRYYLCLWIPLGAPNPFEFLHPSELALPLQIWLHSDPERLLYLPTDLR